MKNEKHFGLRIPENLLNKFRYVCEYEGRSGNAQLLFLIRKCVDEHERAHGKIKDRNGRLR